VSYKHAIMSLALVLMWTYASAHAQPSAESGDGLKFFFEILKQYLQIQSTTPTTTIQAQTQTATAEKSLQEYLVKHCGACHAGTGRVVQRFDMSAMDGLKATKLLDMNAPLESPIWVRVSSSSSRRMPPPDATPLTSAEKSELAGLLRD
jgi:hypothetical protein